ncbi:MAG: trigger factor [Gammaproteobacteria bacterium]
MQVSVEQLEGLERRMTIQVPADDVEKEIQSRLQDLTRKARIDGFRPGKVPFKVVKRMYGPQIRQEVVGDMMRSSFQEALVREKLRPAGGPRLDLSTAAEGGNLEYKATFEVLPDFEPNGIDGLKITRPLASVSDSDIDAMIETLREQRATWHDVERPAQLKDRAMITFTGQIDGADFAGNKADNLPLVLGSGAMVAGFEDKLIGQRTGDELEFDIHFPADHPASNLADKIVHFNVKINNIAEPRLPLVDDSFAANFGIHENGVEGLRKALKETMERELNEGIKANVKRQVMQSLLSANDIALPQGLVRQEIEQLATQAQFSSKEGDEQASTTKQQLFGAEARRRVALGIIVSRLAATQKIQPDPARVQEQLNAIAASYQDSEAVAQWYRRNPEFMDSIYSLVLEDQVVDWLLARAEVTDQPSSFDEIMKPKRRAQNTSAGAPAHD